jgi:TPR repeat protein
MSEQKESGSPSRSNPLVWVALVVIGLIVFVFMNGDRGDIARSNGSSDKSDKEEIVGSIDRSLLVPPAMRARQYIEQLRGNGKPYPLGEVFDRAQDFQQEGSLADAHLMYFFAAREDHLPAIMKMAEMSDPLRFRAEDSLLDKADVIQAYKWYQKAVALGHAPASERLGSLLQWARDESELGNPEARQLLLNHQ